MPYLNPISIAVDCSPIGNESLPVTERLNSASKAAKKMKKKVSKNFTSTNTITDNINKDSVALLEPASKSTIP